MHFRKHGMAPGDATWRQVVPGGARWCHPARRWRFAAMVDQVEGLAELPPWGGFTCTRWAPAHLGGAEFLLFRDVAGTVEGRNQGPRTAIHPPVGALPRPAERWIPWPQRAQTPTRPPHCPGHRGHLRHRPGGCQAAGRRRNVRRRDRPQRPARRRDRRRDHHSRRPRLIRRGGPRGPGRIDRLAAEVGEIDVLVNNAGHAVWAPTEEMKVSDYDAMFAGNVRAAFFLVAAFVPAMAAKRSGSVINIGSMAAVSAWPTVPRTARPRPRWHR